MNYVKEDTNERDISTKNINRINYLNNNNNYNIMKCQKEQQVKPKFSHLIGISILPKIQNQIKTQILNLRKKNKYLNHQINTLNLQLSQLTIELCCPSSRDKKK